MSPLDRRAFLRSTTTLGGSIASVALLGGCGLLSSTPPKRLPRIGYLSVGPRESQGDFIDAFVDGLREVGYVDGQTVVIEWRLTDPHGSGDQFEKLAMELVRLPVDLIVAGASTPAALAALQATRTIPILAVAVRDPVTTGLVSSLAHPGGNLTALATSVAASTQQKGFELLGQMVPGLALVAVLVDSTNPTMVLAAEEVRTAAARIGARAERIDLQSVDDLDAAFETAVLMHADAVSIQANPLLLPVSGRIGELALRYRLPGTGLKQYVEAGLLMQYNSDLAAVHRRAAVYADKILKGAKPADLPVEQPTLIAFVVNAKTAQALGLTIPPDVAAQVTEWIK